MNIYNVSLVSPCRSGSELTQVRAIDIGQAIELAKKDIDFDQFLPLKGIIEIEELTPRRLKVNNLLTALSDYDEICTNCGKYFYYKNHHKFSDNVNKLCDFELIAESLLNDGLFDNITHGIYYWYWYGFILECLKSGEIVFYY